MTLLCVGVSLLLVVQVGGSARNCHPGCRCEVESFGLFDSFSLTRVDCSDVGLGSVARPIPIPLDTSHLDLSSNAISALSGTMLSGPGYTTLVSLDLSANLIAAVDAGAFSRLRYLETLDLSHNALEDLTDGCFSGLPLTEARGGRPLSVDVSNNLLTAVTRGLTGSVPELQSLTLAGNQLRAVPASLRDVGLRYLNLDSNPILEIREGAFAGLGDLVHLSLAGLHELAAVRPGAFRALRSLQVLDMSDAPPADLAEARGVASLPNNILNHLPSLGSVTLGANIHCWKTHKQGQFHRQLGQAKSDQVLTCDVAAIIF
ncbi:hypothetical protein SKAU_G00330560 [Synaphobranchus kaupii]|uniref:LRRNT domain-containing protein n=1 Tax=Synaphobranchus kaupii TaxID=118154 RepID=A0A9Q1EL83_SYNKA|nr:hypothetical protein SKAU_G00330560 [Synaphobranchus kaupii]